MEDCEPDAMFSQNGGWLAVRAPRGQRGDCLTSPRTVFGNLAIDHQLSTLSFTLMGAFTMFTGAFRVTSECSKLLVPDLSSYITRSAERIHFAFHELRYLLGSEPGFSITQGLDADNVALQLPPWIFGNTTHEVETSLRGLGQSAGPEF